MRRLFRDKSREAYSSSFDLIWRSQISAEGGASPAPIAVATEVEVGKSAESIGHTLHRHGDGDWDRD